MKSAAKLVLVSLIISGSLSSLVAQENNTHLPDSLYYFDHFNLDGVTVSGEKRETQMREVAGSITALSSIKMKVNRVLNLTNVSSLVPNLFMPDYGSRLTSPIYIRGIGSRINTPSIGLYVDGVAHFEKSSFNFDFLNIKQIEVLRGPQGTLYGRNTMGGIIQIITHEPQNTRKTYIGGEIGGYGTRSLQFSHDQPLIKDKLGVQLAGQYRQRSGFFLNDFANSMVDQQQSGSGRIKLNYSPTDRFKIQLTSNFERSREGGYPYGIVTISDSTQSAPVIGYDHVSSYDRDMLGSSLRLNYQWNKVEFVSISGHQYIDDYQDIDQDFTPNSWLTVSQDQEQHLFSQEFLFRSRNSERMEWLGGVYGFAQQIDRVVTVNYLADAVPVFNLPGALNKVKAYDFTNTGYAAFGQIRAKDVLLDGLDFVLGARFDSEIDSLGYNYILQMNGNDIPKDDFSQGFDFFEFLPKAAVHYELSSNISTFVSIAKGYKSGGFNSTFEREEDESYGSEYSWNYEWGIKAQTPNKQYLANLAIFYIDWTDQQIYQPVPSGQGSMLKNAGKSKSAGFELEALARPIKNLSLNASVGYTHATFTEYVRDEAKELDYSGNFIPYVPAYTWYAGASYRLPVYRKLVDEILFNINMAGTGRIYWDDANTLTQNPYQLLNARIDYQIKDFTVGLWARNILNTSYLAFQFSALGMNYAQPGMPRLLGLSFSTRF